MIKSIYLSYDGVLEPLGQSQILPYLKKLTEHDLEFILISFEKKLYDNKFKKINCRHELKQHKIKWISLRYHKKPLILSTVFDVIYGFFVCFLAAIREKPKLVHARSYVSSTIALVLKKIFRLKFIFDMRGFWADERVEGRLWMKKGILYHLAKSFEKYMLRHSDEIVVLTEHAKRIIKSFGYTVNNISVIPCCVDTENFRFNNKTRLELRKKFNLNGKFIFIHTGSLEYWYMIEDMLNFFRVAKLVESHLHFLILTHSDKNKIIKLVYDKNLDPKDFTILSVPYTHMPEYLTIGDAGLIFITPVFSKLASSPTKFAEYLSCALPVIINEKIGDMEYYVKENKVGVIVRGFNNNQYRQTFEGFLRLLKDKNLKFRCRQVACNNFSLNAGVDKYYQIYSRLT